MADAQSASEQGRLRSWAARRPRTAFSAACAVTLIIGIIIGAAAASDNGEVDAANDRAAKTGSSLKRVMSELEQAASERDALREDAEATEQRVHAAEAKVKRLTAKAPVPDFTALTADEAVEGDVVSDLHWNVKTREVATSEAEPGRVIDQSVKEGKVLKAGASITLSVAKQPPPKPKTWITIASFSGTASRKTNEFTVPRGLKARIAYDFGGDTNSIIELADPGGDPLSGDLLLNEIGAVSGSTRVYTPGRWYLDVDGGTWSIQVQVFKRPSD